MDDTTNRDQPAPSHISPFERIRQSEKDREFWSARDLAHVLGYTQWRNFEQAISRAIRACRNSGQESANHFAEVSKMVSIGSGAQRNVKDYQLSRYACYLIIQNADPEKEIVALVQTYFAVQTRRQEVADAEILANLNENQRRLYLRGQLADHNRDLSEAANQAGVITGLDFAIFHDHGYMGLYGGLRAQDIHRRKGLNKGQQILDHMGSTELAANLFRATQTEEKLRREQITTKDGANAAHYQVGQVVRRTIQELGGTLPEQLPTPEASIKQLEAEERKQHRQAGRKRATPQLPLSLTMTNRAKTLPTAVRQIRHHEAEHVRQPSSWLTHKRSDGRIYVGSLTCRGSVRSPRRPRASNRIDPPPGHRRSDLSIVLAEQLLKQRQETACHGGSCFNGRRAAHLMKTTGAPRL
jgi:DNA-damage-inducible protein D